jgi:D-alanyl-D-alanine carboxypeptidase
MSFNYRGKAMRNHNRLLGRVDGMDGIKTGYTHSSGFNLVASVRRGHRHIVAAVFGGRSASARDAHMRTLIEQNINEGATRRTAAKILPSPSFGAASPGASFSQDTVSAQAAHIERVTAPTSILPTAGSLAPIQARRVKTLAVKPSTKQQAAVLIGGDPRAAVPPPPPQTTEQGSATSPASGSARHGSANAGTPNISLFSTNSPAPQAMALMSTAGPRSPAIRRGGWIIQIGAFDQESEARQRLKSALDTAKGMLANSDPFTEPVMKGEKTLYRARFAGFDRDRAQAACKLLKRNDFACLALKN